jgi:hypothetical protein
MISGYQLTEASVGSIWKERAPAADPSRKRLRRRTGLKSRLYLGQWERKPSVPISNKNVAAWLRYVNDYKLLSFALVPVENARKALVSLPSCFIVGQPDLNALIYY